jgi:hypothetical protein
MSEADRTVKLTWKELSEVDLRLALSAVKRDADPAAAMKLLECFYRQIHGNLPFDQVLLLEYLDCVFGRIVEGEEPNRVFGSGTR